MESATQEFLEIKEIRDGVLILKNGQIRGLLSASSVNFALKATEEQNSIIFAFQNFLNSLDFSCQIVVQSRHINITPYLDIIKNLREKEQGELLKLQTDSYVEFIKELVRGEQVMTKNFFVVVPYNLAEILGMGAAVKSSLLGRAKEQKLNDEDFEKCKNQLWQRMEFVALGLKRCDLEVIPLMTPELIELFWSVHHLSEAEVGYYPEILPELLK